MHYFKTIYQYKGDDGKVYSKSQKLEEGDAGGFVYDIFTLTTKDEKVYLACSHSIYGTSDGGQCVSLFRIKKDALDDDVKLIKTKTGLHNSLGFEFDFFSVVDRKERPIKLIQYDKKNQAITIPVVIPDKKFQYGRVTNKSIIYKFDGQYFVKAS